MSLTHEVTIKIQGYQVGDMKVAGYSISFTANQLVEPEPGFFLMNGPIVSQTTYPFLFARWGSTFNTGGEGAGNFRLPDFTGKIPLPKGLSNFTGFANSGGEINHTLTSGEIPAHGHTDTYAASITGHSHSGSSTISAADNTHSHTDTIVFGAAVGGSAGGVQDAYSTASGSGTSGAASHGHTFLPSINNASTGNLNISGSVSAAGGGGSHNNMGPYLVMGGWLVRYG